MDVSEIMRNFAEIFTVMIECIDDIKTRIETVKNKTDVSAIDDSKIDKYLDAVLDVKRVIDEIAGDLDRLVDDMYAFVSNLPLHDEIETQTQTIERLKNLCATASKFYAQVRKSKYYPGVKTSAEMYSLSVQGLKELTADLDLFMIKLPNDVEYTILSEKINEMLA